MKNKQNKKGFNPDELVADMLNSSSAEIVVGPDGAIMTKNEAIKKDVDGTRLLKQRVWGSFNGNIEKLIATLNSKDCGKGSARTGVKDKAVKSGNVYKPETDDVYDEYEEDGCESAEEREPAQPSCCGKKIARRRNGDENDAQSMLSSASSEIVVGPDGTIMTKNEAISKDIDGTRLLKQRVWGSAAPLQEEPCAEYGYYSALEDEPSWPEPAAYIEADETAAGGEWPNKSAVEQNSISAEERYEFDVEECDNIFGDDRGEIDFLSISALPAGPPEHSVASEPAGLDEFRANLAIGERSRVSCIVTLFKEFIGPAKTFKKGFVPIEFEFDGESWRYTQSILKQPVPSAVKGAFSVDTHLGLDEPADAVLKRNDRIIRKAVTGEDAVEIFVCINPGREFARSFRVVSRQDDSILLKEILVDIVTLSEDVFSRNKSILETVELKNKRAALVGLGSIGSAVALELAKSGLGNFTLIDLDRLSAANVCRHTCAVTEIGKYKSYAVRDRILKINPFAGVTASICDFTEDLEYAVKLVHGCDLIIVTTDTLASRRMANYLGVLIQSPVIFSGVFERACGGRIFKFDPASAGACLECHQIDTFEERPGAVTYSAARDPRDLTIQPGLSVDINMTATITAKMAIEELRENKDGIMPYNLIITRHYSPEDGVNEPVRFMCARNENIIKNPGCPVCGENSVINER